MFLLVTPTSSVLTLLVGRFDLTASDLAPVYMLSKVTCRIFLFRWVAFLRTTFLLGQSSSLIGSICLRFCGAGSSVSSFAVSLVLLSGAAKLNLPKHHQGVGLYPLEAAIERLFGSYLVEVQ